MPRGYAGKVVSSAEASMRWRKSHPERYKESSRKNEAKRRGNRVPPSSEQVKAWRLRRLEKPGYKERINKVANLRAIKIRRWLDKYKLLKGCVDCGYKERAVALEFDHVNGEKEFNVCNAKSIGQAKKEIEKCEVVCANCHAIRTFDRLQKDVGPDIFEQTYEKVEE